MFPPSPLLDRLIISILSSLIFTSCAQACSTLSFASIYQSYPDCAASCLACPDTDYVNNFAHNCNYTNGDCCRSKFHTVIAESWACVQQSCDGMALAQEAFDIFAKHCEHVDVPLASVDIPQGYASRTDDGSPGSPDANPDGDTDGTAVSSPSPSSSSSAPLSTGTIVGIATGSVVAAAGIVGAIFKCLSYRHKKKQNTSSNGGGVGGGGQTPATTNNQLVQWQPAWQGMPPGALTGDADARATYKRKEFAFAGVRRVKETFEVTRQPTPPAGAVLGGAGGEGRGRGRILGEV
ncbi:hypothetical protein CLCR_06058 [Cladophialophora carrionii]|uniref:Extracellular membrane protein CFEM domain-containing protein n=1 Tax=Cladophialophora carrionii TaxID=86049 RepID=A0A1C1C9X6_9EURO|nr:hypothetical protein CLCR_06058 [Cladophialophora carrionii]